VTRVERMGEEEHREKEEPRDDPEQSDLAEA
jgi:hypothetical protein